MNCPLCSFVELTQKNQYPYFVHEFENSYLMLGEHQYYEGYCVLVLKEHYREMTDLPSDLQNKFFQEMMASSLAVQKTFSPKKMNMCSLGNVAEHLHWHFFPRYETDPNFTNPPWLQMHLFDSAKISPEKREELIQRIRKKLSNC
jgi:diadenosine tetraphosphate (Ap4A) HIT family hydrolase